MPESAGMENTLLTKTLPKTMDPFKVMCSTADSATKNEHGICNTVYIDKVRLAPYTHKAMTEPTETAICRTKTIAWMKTELTKTVLA